jgi:NADPH:quinone reductase-like Zn-dependent oxidoreductase
MGSLVGAVAERHLVAMMMRAACITSFGPPHNIRITRIPVPSIGPGEVLVRTSAVAVNHVDTFIRSGAYGTALTFPFIIGRDLVGSVAEPGDSGLAAGTRVWCNSLGHEGRPGSFSEYAVVPANRLYPLPDGVDPVSAVCVLHTAATAHIGLFREARIQPGEIILVRGVGGGVGSAVAQLAASAEARVVAVDRAENAAWARACGAAAVIDRDDPEATRRIAEVAPFGFDVYWEQSGAPDFDMIVPMMAPRGRIVVIAGLTARAELPVGALYTRDISLHGFAISNASASDLARAARAINRELASGRLRGRVRQTLRLADAARAHQMQESRKGSDPPGRIVLIP